MAESRKGEVRLILPDSSCLNDKLNRMLKPNKSLTGNLYFTMLSFRKFSSSSVENYIVMFPQKCTRCTWQ